MLGLLHTYVSPDGNVMPCCVGDMTKQPLGNINEVSDWNEVWNGDRYTEFRKNMVEGKKNPICSFCYDTEKFSKTSSRTTANAEYSKYYDEYIDYLLPTGELTTSKLKYLDFRFTNKCNQACITCGHALSSSWFDLMKKLNQPITEPKFIEPQDKRLAYKLIDDNLDSVESIYFAGGEPLLSEYHWYTLDKLIGNSRSKEVSLRYSSNCSTLYYKGKNILDYWKQFKSVIIVASVDEVNDRFNYIRWPGNWEIISSNLKKIRESFDQSTNGELTHTLVYSPVVSSLNVHRLKEIIQEIISKEAYQFSILNHKQPIFEYFLFCNLLRNPDHLSIINMPDEHWNMTEETLDEFQQWYCDNILSKSEHFAAKKDMFCHGINQIKEMRKMSQNDMEFFDQTIEDQLGYMKEYSKMDKARKTDFMNTFPELHWLYQ
jgi:radical SAM protein with 4Fe4S-binding SPASM domain